MTDTDSEDIESYAAPPASPSFVGALRGEVHRRAMALAEGVGGFLPAGARSAGARAMKALEDRRRATIDHAILSQQRRCLRIKEIETHVETKLRELEANEEEFQKYLRALREVSRETETLLEHNMKENLRFKKRLEKVRKEHRECTQHIEVLAERHVQQAAQKAREEATAHAMKQAALAKKKANI